MGFNFPCIIDSYSYRVSRRIWSAIRIKARTVAIDSVSELLLIHDIKDIVNLLTSMTHQNRKSQNFQLLLLTEGMQTPQEETTINHFAEGAINFP